MSNSWQRFCEQYCAHADLGLRLDISKMELPEEFSRQMQEPMDQALEAMAALEAGAVANPDEGRQVGHYWLRAPELAPTAEHQEAIEESIRSVTDFTRRVHDGSIRSAGGQRFEHLLVVGIGGSALGPQLVADALGTRQDRMTVDFLDNTDPDGIARVLGKLHEHLGQTLIVVISKSGGTPETRNGMLLTQAAFAEQEIDFAGQAVAITGAGSKLDRLAEAEGWLARFPMWDWVGGRTSVTSAVGLLPAALQGLDIEALLTGARQCDAVTRERQVPHNPAALLALCWHHATGGRGERDMVILPYKDRLLLLSRYLQQLVMESLGKGTDLDGNPVAQGIAVYGNKGSTDQHAYVQQLREGVDNFFATFIEVLEDGGSGLELESGITAGDYLRGFRLGTREALAEAGRCSITLTIERVDAHALGVLIALFERAVGLYASLIHINAYHQPGVEAGKKAAAAVLELQHQVLADMSQVRQPRNASEIALAIGRSEQTETVFHLLEALAFNQRGVVRQVATGESPCSATYHLA